MQRRVLPSQPPNNKEFMDKFGWPLLLVCATIIGTVIGAIIQGSTHVIGFDWLVTILAAIMLSIVVFCIWYTVRTQKKMQEQYYWNIAAINNDATAFRNNMSSNWGEDTQRRSEWVTSYTQQVKKEHDERTEALKTQCMEAIHDAEQRLDSKILNAQSQFSSAVKSYDIAVDGYKDHLLQTWNRITALEEQVKAYEERLKEPVPESEE